MNKSAWKKTAWRTQISDLNYHTDKIGGVWTDRVTRRDRNPQVTDKDIERRDAKFGATRWSMSVKLADRLIAKLPREAAWTVTARRKWEVVDLVAAGRLDAAMDTLGL